jgi:hypothetical protein
VLLLNVADVGALAVAHMRVENAAQMGAHTIWMQCEPITHFPISTKCPAYTATESNPVRTAVEVTFLKRKVEWEIVSPAEGYYCTNSSNTLTYIGALTITPPANCQTYGQPNAKPGVYARVDAKYVFNPIFGAFTVIGLTATDRTIRKTAYMRLL